MNRFQKLVTDAQADTHKNKHEFIGTRLLGVQKATGVDTSANLKNKPYKKLI